MIIKSDFFQWLKTIKKDKFLNNGKKIFLRFRFETQFRIKILGPFSRPRNCIYCIFTLFPHQTLLWEIRLHVLKQRYFLTWNNQNENEINPLKKKNKIKNKKINPRAGLFPYPIDFSYYGQKKDKFDVIAYMLSSIYFQSVN